MTNEEFEQQFQVLLNIEANLNGEESRTIAYRKFLVNFDRAIHNYFRDKRRELRNSSGEK